MIFSRYYFCSSLRPHAGGFEIFHSVQSSGSDGLFSIKEAMSEGRYILSWHEISKDQFDKLAAEIAEGSE